MLCCFSGLTTASIPAWDGCSPWRSACTPLLSRVTALTLVIHCDRDHVVAAEKGRYIAAAIPNARYVSLPGANHLMLEEERAWAMFLEELGLFLNW